MKDYIVGGYIRDQLLGRPTSDKDWVVVDGNHNGMIDRGFMHVGQFFPVYIHSQTGEEYALARKERKTSAGHQGFACVTEAVTLEDDLVRRDLTVNAIAQTTQGELIDPFGGYRDIQSRVLRHISPAFSEDPLRVLRVARLAAQLAGYGFRVAEETRELMRHISASGELQTLSQERVFQETRKALNSDTPSYYFTILRDVGALQVLFPEIEALFGVPQKAEYHPEVDTGIHLMMVLDQSARLCSSEQVRFACLCHDFGKALTPAATLPSHTHHEQRGIKPVRTFCNRLKVPNSFKKLALQVCEFHLLGHRILELRAGTIVKLLDSLDFWRQPQAGFDFILCCEADAKGRLGFESVRFTQKDLFVHILESLLHHRFVPKQGLVGDQIRTCIHRQRCRFVNAQIKQWKAKHAQ